MLKNWLRQTGSKYQSAILDQRFKKLNTNMKNKIILAIILFSSFGAFAQVTREEFDKEIKTLTEKIKTLQLENSNRKSQIGVLTIKLKAASDSIETLNQKTQENTNAIIQTANQLGIQIKETSDNTKGKITEVSKSLSKNSLYGVIGVLSAILLSGLLYWLLSRRQQTDKTDIIDQLSKTKSAIEESLIKEFGKQTVLMESQLQIIEKQASEVKFVSNVEPDHSLALKLASEINLIERNISLMDSATKGLKQLSRSVGKLKDNLGANGYEMPELLGRPFNQGMKLIVTSSIPDNNLEKGAEIITKILIPQVNFQEKMIQAAQIEVSVGF
jgi:hypothetical protein